MRGRLIRPAVVELLQVDTDATSADPGVDGLDSGYDEDFGEPAKVDGESVLKYKDDLIRLHAQVEVNEYDHQQAASIGQDKKARVTLVFHFQELEDLGLVDEDTGEPLIRVNDRLVAMYKAADESLIMKFEKPYLYATQVRPYGPGLGGERNLLIVDFNTRDAGTQL
jgi:hypothetical protein